MPTPKKAEQIEKLKKELQGATSVLISHYRGLTVEEDTLLRKKLREIKAVHKVVKNTLAKRAAEESDMKELSNYLNGPAVITISKSDIVVSSKLMVDFAKQHEKFQILGGLIEGKAVTGEDVKIIASLPSREELIAKLLMLLNSPVTGLVRTLNGPVQGFTRVIKTISDEKVA
jgi:large subunit ribosomal protein L10